LADGTVETLADSYKGRRLNCPNDVICAPNGDIIFTDPSFSLRRNDGTKPGVEYPYEGVFRYSAADGSLKLLADDFIAPNGLAMSEDGSLLYVVDSLQRAIRLFDVAEDGSLSKGRVFAEAIYGAERTTPDGMKLDSQGNVYLAANSNHGIWVFSAGGVLLGFIRLPETPENLAWGDDDWQSMFITARTSVYRLRTRVPGQPVHLA
jgi:gluconolactonase